MKSHRGLHGEVWGELLLSINCLWGDKILNLFLISWSKYCCTPSLVCHCSGLYLFLVPFVQYAHMVVLCFFLKPMKAGMTITPCFSPMTVHLRNCLPSVSSCWTRPGKKWGQQQKILIRSGGEEIFFWVLLQISTCSLSLYIWLKSRAQKM